DVDRVRCGHRVNLLRLTWSSFEESRDDRPLPGYDTPPHVTSSYTTSLDATRGTARQLTMTAVTNRDGSRATGLTMTGQRRVMHNRDKIWLPVTKPRADRPAAASLATAWPPATRQWRCPPWR
ncbi:hypothetical protein BI295_22945, partial [Mycobacterium avium subsp. hominissuis]